jgi:hypothetical protein
MRKTNFPTRGDSFKLGCACRSQESVGELLNGEHHAQAYYLKIREARGTFGHSHSELMAGSARGGSGRFHRNMGNRLLDRQPLYHAAQAKREYCEWHVFAPKFTIDGIVKGKVLDFSWSQDGGHAGTGTFTLSGDGNSFHGTWFHTTGQGEQTQGTWVGRRK